MRFAISAGLALIVCGYLIQQWVAREWAERKAAEAERIIGESAHRQQLMVRISTPGADDMDALIAELLDTPRVPQQRRGGRDE